ncbi:MAG: hypothetical protein PHU51_02895 [Candidatus Nanoarchaeia archaeon]|nr:hypothetical protein [Candidatus Nanoarchaeia archaeon]
MVENYNGLTTDNSADYSRFEKLRNEVEVGDELITYKPNSNEIDLEGIIIHIHETLPFLVLRVGNKHVKCTTLKDLYKNAYLLDKFEINKDNSCCDSILFEALTNYSGLNE